jgi:hypothetical protein
MSDVPSAADRVAAVWERKIQELVVIADLVGAEAEDTDEPDVREHMLSVLAAQRGRRWVSASAGTWAAVRARLDGGL